MSAVREILEDPAYSGFFLKFKPGGSFPNGSYYVPNCNTYEPTSLCSEYYHDQASLGLGLIFRSVARQLL